MTIVVFSPQRLKKMMGTNSLTQELKLEGTKCPMILVLRSIILKKKLPMNQWVCVTH